MRMHARGACRARLADPDLGGVDDAPHRRGHVPLGRLEGAVAPELHPRGLVHHVHLELAVLVARVLDHGRVVVPRAIDGMPVAPQHLAHRVHLVVDRILVLVVLGLLALVQLLDRGREAVRLLCEPPVEIKPAPHTVRGAAA